MKTWFTSDPHFGHGRIIDHCARPWPTEEKMTDGLIDRWNSKVDPRDTVWLFGALFFVKLSTATSIMCRLNGEKHLILGNHDGVIRKNPALRAEFHKIYPDLYQENIDGHLVVMSHFPLMSWNKSYHGSFMLHGHSHGMLAFDPKVRRMDVGVDCHDWYPIEWNDIKARLEAVPVPSSVADDPHEPSTMKQIITAMDEAHEYDGPLHKRIRDLINHRNALEAQLKATMYGARR